MDEDAPPPHQGPWERPFKAVVYGPASTKRTHGCYDLVRVEPAGGLMRRVTHKTLVNPFMDVKCLKNPHWFRGSRLEIWDLTFANPRMNGLLAGYMADVSVVVVAVPEQTERIQTQETLRAYEDAARAMMAENVPLHTLVITRADTHQDVAAKLSRAFVSV